MWYITFSHFILPLQKHQSWTIKQDSKFQESIPVPAVIVVFCVYPLQYIYSPLILTLTYITSYLKFCVSCSRSLYSNTQVGMYLSTLRFVLSTFRFVITRSRVIGCCNLWRNPLDWVCLNRGFTT